MDEKYVKSEHKDLLSPILATDMQDDSMAQNEYLETMRQDLSRKQELDNSEWNGIIQRKNSSYMDDVKTANNLLHEFLLKPMSIDEIAFQGELTELTQRYETLIDKCRAYLVKRRRAITPTGKARYRMVKQLLASSLEEKSRLKDSAYDIFLNIQSSSDVLWGNTLNETRRTNLYSDGKNEGHDHGASSEVTIIEGHGETYYFKKAETLQPFDKMLETEIFNDSKFLGKAELLKHLKPYMTGGITNPLATTFKSIGNKIEDYKPATAVRDFNAVLKVYCPNDKPLDASYGDLLMEICPKIARLLTLTGIANDAGIEEGRPIAIRNVATSRLAEALGISNLIAQSMTANLIRPGENGEEVITKGNAMKKAKGSSLSKIREENGIELDDIEYSPEAIRQLNILRVFDVICGQIDRNGSNVLYQYKMQNGKAVITGIQGIDNDSSFGVINYDAIKRYKSGILQLRPVEAEGEVMLKYIDTDFAAAIMVITDDYIRKLMADILSQEEIAALSTRIHGLQALINSRNVTIVNKNDWTEEQATEVVKNKNDQKPVYLQNINIHSEQKPDE